MRPAWRRTLAVLFGLAVVAGVGLALRGQDWSVVGQLLHPGSVPALLGAVLVTAVGLLCGTRAWLLTLSAIAVPVPARTGVRMFFVGFLGKFVPGRVWGLIAQLRMGGQAGVSKAQMAGVYVVNLVIVLLTGGAVGVLVAPPLFDDGAWWMLLPLVLLVALLARPELVHRSAVLAARAARRRPPPSPGRPGDLRRAVLYQTASWVLSGLHVWVTAVLLGADPLPALPAAVGGFALATVGGTLVMFAPDGAGVRELLLVPALATVLPLPAAVAAALASRVLTLVAELTTSGVALGAATLHGRRTLPPSLRKETAA
jgi:hypothetical protein